MTSFKLIIDNVTYDCNGTQSNRQLQNWHIISEIDKFRTVITVPIEVEMSMAKVMLFVERYHVAMKKAKDEQ